MLRKLAMAAAVVSALAFPSEVLAFHGGGGGGGFHGGGGVARRRRWHGGGYRGGGVYRGGASIAAVVIAAVLPGRRLSRRLRGLRRRPRSYWGGRYWGYGVGPCWSWNPYSGGWIWVCY